MVERKVKITMATAMKMTMETRETTTVTTMETGTRSEDLTVNVFLLAYYC